MDGFGQTGLRVPTYPTESEAIASLQTEAARVGADGLINISCLDQGRSTKPENAEPAVLCYAIAIRVGRSGG